MSERHYQIVIDDEKGHSTMVRLDGLATHAKAAWVRPTKPEARACRAFVQALVDEGVLERVNIAEDEDVIHHENPAPSQREQAEEQTDDQLEEGAP